jgi:hypothetical protein
MSLVDELDAIEGQRPPMDHDWLGAIFTAFLLAPPSVLGIRSLIRGPTRFAGKVVPIGMDRLAAAVWLSVCPSTIAIVFIRLFYFPPRTQSEANYLANEWGPFVLRAISVCSLLIGGAIDGVEALRDALDRPTAPRPACEAAMPHCRSSSSSGSAILLAQDRS